MGAMQCQAGEARKKDVLRKFYDEHYATVQAMVPPDRLCVMRLGDGWEPLVSGLCLCCLHSPMSNLADCCHSAVS